MERSAKPLQFLVDCNFEIQEGGGDIKYASNLFNFLSFFFGMMGSVPILSSYELGIFSVCKFSS